MIELRESQIWCAAQCIERIKKFGIVYLAAEVRTGKTITALQVMEDMEKQHVLFITKKKAISSIQRDYDAGEFSFNITIINYESLHTLHQTNYDGIICDEAHCFGAMPKPSLRAKNVKLIVKATDTILMSGSPNPETLSQLYHQFWVHELSPWKYYKNFYYWANAGYVFKYTKPINGFNLNFYDRGNKEKIMNDVEKYMVKLSQEEAGFISPVTEKFWSVPMKHITYELVAQLKEDKVTQYNNKDIAIETPAKAMMKFRQIYSGTVKYEDGTSEVIDDSKVRFIKNNFSGRKIAIYYNFIAEGDYLKKEFANWTDDPMKFNDRNDLIFICQMVSGREGINLSTADCLVMYNIDFSATTYFQVRARLQDKNRTTPAEVNWLFSLGGIEERIYKMVSKKKNYTTAYFMREYGMKF